MALLQNTCFFPPHHVILPIANIMSDQMDNIWRGKVSLWLMFNHMTHYLEQTRASPALPLYKVLVMKHCLDTRSDTALSRPSEEAGHIWPLLLLLLKHTWSKTTASHYHLLSLFFFFLLFVSVHSRSCKYKVAGVQDGAENSVCLLHFTNVGPEIYIFVKSSDITANKWMFMAVVPDIH